MKKYLLVLAAFAMTAASLFAADYVVESVTGKAQYESAPGVWKNVEVGQKLSPSTNLNTSLNSSVVLASGNEKVTIKAMQKGALDSLIDTNTASKGIKKGAIRTNAIASKTDGGSKGVATASSRASEAKEDVEWDE